jgi:hypothetical protein
MQGGFLFGYRGNTMNLPADKNNSDLAIDNPDVIQALNNCITHAAEHYGLSITDIATHMQVSKWTLFKWVESGRIPLLEIAKFEDACHARFVTRYLAERSGFLLLTKPLGSDDGLQSLASAHKVVAEALAHTANFLDDKGVKKQSIKAIDAAMEALANQRRRIAHE